MNDNQFVEEAETLVAMLQAVLQQCKGQQPGDYAASAYPAMVQQFGKTLAELGKFSLTDA